MPEQKTEKLSKGELKRCCQNKETEEKDGKG